MKTYYIIENKKESGNVVMSYVATSEKKAIEFLKKEFKVEQLGAAYMGVKAPIDTTDNGFFFYNGNDTYKGGEWRVRSAGAAF